MKKILIVGVSNIVGGIETLFKGLFQEKSKIFDISFLSFDKECAFSNLYRENGYNIYVLPSRRSNPFLFSKNIKRFLKNHNDFDYIWINTSATSVYQFQYYGKKHTKAKIISHSHGTQFENTSGNLFYIGNKILAKINRKKAINNTDLFFACSQKAGIALFGESNINKIIVIKNGIDTKKFRYNSESKNRIRNKLSIDAETYVIGMIGRLSQQKNPIKGIDIFNSLLKIVANSVLVIVGEGDLRKSIESRVTELGLRNKVLFLGLRNDVYDILSAIDILIMPSLFEGLPLTAIEAQASGCVCVLSNEITDEVKITKLVNFVDLNDNNEKWAQIIKLNLLRYDINRSEYFEEVKKEKYDRNDTIKFIENLLTME